MERLSIRIADLLLREQYISEERYSIYQYGMQVALEIGCSFISSILICCLWGKVVEGMIFFAAFIPLRSYLGGIHMKSYWACFVCSCASLIGILLLVDFLEVSYYISWIILGISFCVILLAAQKERKKDRDGKHFYPRIGIIIFLTFMAGIICTVFAYPSKLFLLACTDALAAFSKLLEREV